MARLIDANEVERKIRIAISSWQRDCNSNDQVIARAMEDALQRVIYAPTVGAVEVVRCKDCKHLMFSDCYGECGEGHMGIVSPDDFCSHGIRKDGDGNG